MTSYKLKTGAAPFEVMDGPLAGRQFNRNGVYVDIPPNEADKFEEIKEERIQKSQGLRNQASKLPGEILESSNLKPLAADLIKSEVTNG